MIKKNGYHEMNHHTNILVAIPRKPGAYGLHLHLYQPKEILIGRLGSHLFPAGGYLYLGSAFGPGGLAARLGRHLRGGSHPHWHIDALRAVSQVKGYCYLVRQSPTKPTPLECLWSQALTRLPGTRVPAPGFGASDCRSGCPAHLVALPDDGTAKGWLKELAPVLAVAAGAHPEAVVCQAI
jgi:Uri superfamily endonuclease